jgi:hypothetical protein
MPRQQEVRLARLQIHQNLIVMGTDLDTLHTNFEDRVATSTRRQVQHLVPRRLINQPPQPCLTTEPILQGTIQRNSPRDTK